jgi:hypothetical protein
MRSAVAILCAVPTPQDFCSASFISPFQLLTCHEDKVGESDLNSVKVHTIHLGRCSLAQGRLDPRPYRIFEAEWG